MDEKSGSSGVISSNASSVKFSMYIAGYTFDTVLLQAIRRQSKHVFWASDKHFALLVGCSSSSSVLDKQY